jgi:hypothetical protein
VFFPVRDGVGADAEQTCGEVSVPAKEILDLEDSKPLYGGVVGTMAVGELVESGAEDLDDLPGEFCLELSLLESRGGFGEGVIQTTEFPQKDPGCESEEVCGVEDGAKGELVGLGLELVSEAEADGRSSGFIGRGIFIRHLRSPYPRLRGQDGLPSRIVLVPGSPPPLHPLSKPAICVGISDRFALTHLSIFAPASPPR